MSAAYLEGLSDERPEILWLAIPAALHGAKLDSVPHRLLRWSFAGAFDIGIADAPVEGSALRRTGPARTVVDLIRYQRHLNAKHVGIRAGRRFKSRGGDPREILDIARRTKIPAAALWTVSVLVEALS